MTNLHILSWLASLVKTMSLLSDQVNQQEIDIILRELARVITQKVPGDITEFGCYVGTTSVYLAKTIAGLSDRELYVYDSFEGLPEKTSFDVSPLGESFRPGELSVSKKQFQINIAKNGVIIKHIKKAWFKNLTLGDIPDKVAFVYLDGDYYMSIVDPLRLLRNHLSKGAIIVVDDYSNPALPGVAKAVDEWTRRHGLSIRVEHSLAIINIP